MAKFGKKNHVKIDPLAYNIALLGEPKIGKTTLIYEVVKKLAGDDGYIFLEMGKEDGAAAIEGIIYENVPNWEYFEEIVDDITENKEEDYPNLKVVIIDTYDGFIDIAEPETIRRSNNANKNKKDFKKANTINEAWGGFQKGQQKCLEMMLDALWELKSVGVSFIVIGHVKQKDKTDIWTGESYSILTNDVEQRYFTGLMKKLHVCGLAYMDRSVETIKTGKKNIVTGKEETKNVVKGESRKINFRDTTSYVADTGGRFADIVEEIEFGADNFIKAIEDAIKAEQAKSGVPLDVARAKEEQEKEEHNQQKAMKSKQKKQISTLKKQILSYIKEHKSDITIIMPIVTKCKELCGSQNPEDLETLEDTQTVYEMIKE